jgi:hypothetical protein
MNKVLILNGPPNSGKDTIADVIEKVYGFRHRRFKDRLYEIASLRSGCAGIRKYIRLCNDREKKDVPYDGFTGEFKGMSPRESLIFTSEKIIKPSKGSDYFGQCLADNIDSELTVVSDGGFIEEIEPLVERGYDVYIAQLTREGCSFDGDSRSYVYPLGCKFNWFLNDDDVCHAVDDIMKWMRESENEACIYSRHAG